MAQITTKEYLTKIQKGIDAELTENNKALPKDFNRQRFTLNCIAILKDNLKDWNRVDPSSIITTFAKGAYLGLDFFNGECYAIPYGGVANFQTDYKGEIKLCKKYSKNPIKDIYAKNVRKGDFFEEKIEDGKQTITFKPVPFSDEPIIGSFAVVLFKDGSMIYDTMSVTEIEKIRKAFSKAQNSKAWKETPGEMYKKTVLRRICKLIDLDFDNIEQQKAFQDGGDFEAQKEIFVESEVVEPQDPFTQKESFNTQEVISAPAQEMPENIEPARQERRAAQPVQQEVQQTQQEDFMQFEQSIGDLYDSELPFR